MYWVSYERGWGWREGVIVGGLGEVLQVGSRQSEDGEGEGGGISPENSANCFVSA